MWRTTGIVLPRCFVKSVAVLPHILTNEFVLISEFVHPPEQPPDPALALSLLHSWKFKPHLLAKISVDAAG